MATAISPHEALCLALKRAGSQSAIGRICGVSQPSVWAWLRKEKGAPAEYVLRIEEGTGVSRYLLRPDIYPPSDANPREPFVFAGEGLAVGSCAVVCDRTAGMQRNAAGVTATPLAANSGARA